MNTIHEIVRRGDVEALRHLLASASNPKALANEAEADGDPPLFEAVRADPPRLDIVRLLLEAGADPGYVKVTTYLGMSQEQWLELSSYEGIEELYGKISDSFFTDDSRGYRESLLSGALEGNSVETIRLLREHGADLMYRREHGSTALIDALSGDGDRVEIVRYLIGLGLDVDATTEGDKSPASVAALWGKFAALAELLKAGADEAPLRWTPLHRAVAVGTLADVERELDRGGDPDVFDRGGRTALQLALFKGDGAAAGLLLRRGADPNRKGADGTSSLVYAVEGGRPDLLERILAMGVSSEDKNAALNVALGDDLIDAARVLLAAGADPCPVWEDFTLLENARSRDMILLLHAHGADLADLDSAGRRALLGFGKGDDDALDSVSREAYLAGRHPQEGRANPQDVGDPFRLAMIRVGWNAYRARDRYDDPAQFACHLAGEAPPAVWCFDRFGQSTTLLPNGRIVLVAGKHKDYYDPDFWIYNDVTVFDPAGGLTLYGYPYETFPPTDFHSATLVGGWIYLLGSLGYAGSRKDGMPVYRLSVEDFRIERVATQGEEPGRIYRHRAVLLPGDRIRIEGGTRISFQGSEEAHTPNEEAFVLDVATRTWSRV